MNEQIFDWNENSEKILRGEGYSTYHSLFREQVAVIRYLLDRGKTKEEIFEIWKSTSPKEILYADTEEEKWEFFGRVWRKAKKWVNRLYPPIQIYQEEMDFINGMDVTPWVREYVLVLLCIYKYYGQTWCAYTNRIKCFCYSQTYVKIEREQYTLKLCDCIKEYNPYTTVIHDCNVAFKINFAQCLGTRLATIKNPSEVQKLFPYLKNEKVCACCGALFTYNSGRIKRTICDECYRKERNRKKNSGKYDRKVQITD